MPLQVSGTNFVPGIAGSAINLPVNNLLTYQSAGNINALEGTCAFWIKPNWSGNDNVDRTALMWGFEGGLVIQKDANPNFRMIVNLLRPEGNGYGQYASITNWQANQWHHVAYTWSSANRFVKAYLDGRLVSQGRLNYPLPQISYPTFRIGANTDNGAYLNAAIDELRISDIPRTDAEIAQSFFAAITVTSLTVEPKSLHLFPGWFWTPKLTATTNLGTMQVSSAGVNWTSSDPNTAIVQADGRVKCLAPGNVTLTARLQNASDSMNILVKAPVLPTEVGPVPAALGALPSDSLYTIPVLILRYLPTADGVNIDTAYDADLGPQSQFPLAMLKSQIADYDPRIKFMLEEGSRFRGYSNPNARRSLGYKVVQYITVYEPPPPGPIESVSNGIVTYRPDYDQIFERWNIKHFVEDLAVKEIWLWNVPGYYRAERPDMRPESYVGLPESNMSSPTTGDISNSYRDNADLPIYNQTYVLYAHNVHRTQAEAIHNHGHQLESILSHVNQRQDGNTDLWWGKFARAANNPPARCGNTHFPPNATQDYDYGNLTLVASDILNWQPAGGPTTMVNANTWGNVPYAWPGGIAPPQEVESKWYIFWFQSMAGRSSNIPYNANRLTNWWQFTGDWDVAIQAGLGLYEPGACNYTVSSNTQSIPASGGAGSINVNCNTGCKWIASSNEPWLTVSANNRTGSGNGSVSFSISANPGDARSGTLAIAGQVFTLTQGANNTRIANVSAASYAGDPLALDSIIAAFGSGLANATRAAAILPLPTELAGTTVRVKNGDGIERLAPLFFVSPTQVNYQMPPGLAAGAATVTIINNSGATFIGTAQLAAVVPALFTANASGRGLPAALVLRVKSGGAQSFEPLAHFDPATNRFVAVPIDLGVATDQVFLILYGTGIRNRSNLATVTATIGGVNAPASFAGAQGSLIGVDQVNLQLPRSLAGRGQVDVSLSVNGQAANLVQVSFR
ncbi:MAG: Ig-like domain-containing protein [Acidobacteria bacterium]|nr:Ig-like domain-containing protein [Acidobacteriota bacterium]MBI3426301.1 Ig-like domain-containing protein [Acidobacteriota bacterium]